jgi:hypothetical protein
VLVCTAITANVLTYFNGKRRKISFKGKINLEMKQVVIFADEEQVLRQIDKWWR